MDKCFVIVHMFQFYAIVLVRWGIRIYVICERGYVLDVFVFSERVCVCVLTGVRAH